MEVETKMAVPLDDQDTELTIMALTVAANDEWYRGNTFRAAQYRIITRRFIEEKARFQPKLTKILEEKYGINGEKPAVRAADLSVDK